ncbi:MAG TPA: hypothetical protein VNS32_19550 [Flavisolibacter sp.]|nr:hypothetical protein [Flavisolibacter sp.]
MYKRTWGYFLLTMLVVTGLAGRHHSETFSGKERRELINELKSSRTQILKSIEHLNNIQLRYKDQKGASIHKHMEELVSTEGILWQKMQEAINQNHQTEITSQTNQEWLSNKYFASDVSQALLKQSTYKIASTQFSTIIDQFKIQENNLLRYLRTSTDDVHHHFVKTPAGTLNVYQLLTVDLACMQYYLQAIEKIKRNKNFPR